MAKPISKVIFSPHLDDACFSSFNNIHSDTLVVTVFTGKPKKKIKTKWDTLCGFSNSNEAMESRLNENNMFLKFAGCVGLNMGFLDNQYQQKIPLKKIYTAIKRVVESNSSASFYIPLARGYNPIHPDHKIVSETVFNICKTLNISNFKFYADMPYAIQNASINWFKVEDPKRKIKGCKLYSSQFKTLQKEYPYFNINNIKSEAILNVCDYKELRVNE